MSDTVELFIDRQPVTVAAGTSVAAAIAMAGGGITRRSVGGMLRAPLCGMGVCQECRVTIDDRAHRLACQTPCAAQMRVETAAATEDDA
ncbi:2Fe-2S iron-sulfur cluster-binding protein [Undibacterium arcticum]|uniref:2Fe-2S iron-sulfur cluster-binding protein n=1 Tax=Undibacterium arcticum TaxID=1762892 RepID=A0ABV7F1A4_9BURK